MGVQRLDLVLSPLEGRDEQEERLRGPRGSTLEWFLISRAATARVPLVLTCFLNSSLFHQDATLNFISNKLDKSQMIGSFAF